MRKKVDSHVGGPVLLEAENKNQTSQNRFLRCEGSGLRARAKGNTRRFHWFHWFHWFHVVHATLALRALVSAYASLLVSVVEADMNKEIEHAHSWQEAPPQLTHFLQCRCRQSGLVGAHDLALAQVAEKVAVI